MAKPTILVVDDDPTVLRLIAIILDTAQVYEVLAADSAEAGLQIGLEREINLLVSDVVMPRMWGTELAQKLQEARPGLRVVLVSGNLEGDVQGMQDDWRLLKKPFFPKSLLDVVARTLAG